MTPFHFYFFLFQTDENSGDVKSVIASGSHDCSIKFWDVHTGKVQYYYIQVIYSITTYRVQVIYNITAYKIK